MNFTFTTDVGDLDIFGEVTGLCSYEKALAFSEEMNIFGGPCMEFISGSARRILLQVFLPECTCLLDGSLPCGILPRS